MTAEGSLPGEQGNLDDGKGCHEIFQSTSEFSGVGMVMAWLSQSQGLDQVNVSYAPAAWLEWSS